ncbi:MAG: GAF domain-containing protein [Bacteroidota bacterium]|nr:GAF domain-containing protein [Bacteroidota bacterium]
MHHQITKTEATDHTILLKQVESIVVDNIPASGNVCNILALLKSELNLFWCGLYMRTSEDQLGLGPFQGLPACTVITLGKGVCGTAAKSGETIIVEDVNQFPGYIACHSETRSEIVVPGFKDGKVAFVLDVDSVEVNFFKDDHKKLFESVVRGLERVLYL